MDIEQLEKLKKLKDKGVITEEEFQEQKRSVLHSISSADNQKNFKKKEEHPILGALSLLCIIISLFYFFSDDNKKLEPKFACDKSSMQFAEDVINKFYKSFNNSFRLSEPLHVEQSENFLKCKAKTNYPEEFPAIYYELRRQPDGEILVYADPYNDKFRLAIEEIADAVERAQSKEGK